MDSGVTHKQLLTMCLSDRSIGFCKEKFPNTRSSFGKETSKQTGSEQEIKLLLLNRV